MNDVHRRRAGAPNRRRRDALRIGAAYAFYLLVGARRGQVLEAGRRNALALLRLERRLGIDVERRLQRAVLERGAARAFCNALYLTNQVAAAPAAYALLARRRPEAASRFCSVAAGSMATAAVWHALQPVAPPRSVSADIVDTVTRDTIVDLDSKLVRAFYNPVAAVPSLHIVAASLSANALLQVDRQPLVRAAALAYASSVAVAVVATGNHYVLDIAAGLVVGAGVAVAARQLQKLDVSL